MKRTLLTLLCAGACAASAQQAEIKIPEQERPTADNTRAESGKGELLSKGPRLDDLPGPVIQRVKQYPLQIADIDVEKWEGKTVYEIEFKTDGLNKRIHVQGDGTLVKDSRKEGDNIFGLFLGTQMKDLPPAAQQTVTKHVGGKGVIMDIDRVNWTGDPVYEVTYKLQTAGERKFQVAADGNLINEAAGSENLKIGDDRNSKADLKVDLDKDPSLESLPAAVQSAVLSSGNGKIVDIDIKEQDGKKVYEVDFQREGINRRIEYNADGSVIKDNARD